jgi:hypothetical protein
VMPVTQRAANDAAQYVAATFVGWSHAVAYEERA